uniref:NADH dehydrogenase subunit 6 n=1 Tax=Gondogeneia antarctica TaxID=1109128 RepID=G8IQQ3_GONAN|nr:NADH dehydrogenase subunit 6 [Gondogeneia antarctica]
MLMLFSPSIFLSTFLFYFNTPLSMAFLIISHTILISVYIYLTLKTTWFSFFLLMVFLSAMAVIFVYISAMASNEMMYLHTSAIFVASMFTVLFMLMLIFTNNTLHLNPFSSTINESSLPSIAITLYKMYSYNTMTLTLTLIVYLLLALIIVVKNASICSAPLRSFK